MKDLINRLIKQSCMVVAALILFNGCIQEIDPFKGGTSPIIITGTLTNQVGPHTVNIVRSQGFNEAPNFNEYSLSDVKIVDDLGNEESLSYAGNGDFETSLEFKGEINRVYTLKVTLQTGEQFESEPQQLFAVPEVDEVDYVFNDAGQVEFSMGFQDNPDTVNYYRYRFQGTYEVFSPTPDGIDGGIPIRSSSTCYTDRINFNRATSCWLKDFDNEFLMVGSDELTNGLKVEELSVYAVDYDYKFNIMYSGELMLYSLTEEAYGYWSSIAEQIGNTGTIFEKSPYQITGNMKSSDGQLPVIGLFQVSAVQSKRIFINEFAGSFPELDCTANDAGCFPSRCISCLGFGPSASMARPDFWPEQ